jgi:phospholipid N-methyltransferase
MWLFFKEALKGFVVQGSLFPSSPYLTRQMLEPVLMKKGVRIVELGAGQGVFTRELLSRLPADGRLVVFELNPAFAQHLRKILNDARVTIIEDDALRLNEHLKRLHITTVDYVVSGLPIGNFKYSLRQGILLEIQNALNDTGRYIQFQYFLASLRHIKHLFDTRIIGYEVRNMPPAFIYVCKKYSGSNV